MSTSRGVRLALLAARGLLNCPSDYNNLYVYFKETGIDIELTKEIRYQNMNAHLMNKDLDSYNEEKKKLNKLLYPDVETPEERIMREAAILNKGPQTVTFKRTSAAPINMSQFKKVYTNAN